MLENTRKEVKTQIHVFKSWDNIPNSNLNNLIGTIKSNLDDMNMKAHIVFVKGYTDVKGSMSEVISTFSNMTDLEGNPYLICTLVAPLKSEFPETEYCMPEDKRSDLKPVPFEEVFARDCGILSGMGFENVNDNIPYEYSRPMIYKNNIGNKVISTLH